MSVTEQIIQLAQENHGIVTTAMVSKAGVSRGNLKYLVDSGRLERTARGVYILPDAWEDGFVNLQSRFKRGIFSDETALYLLDMTDRTPNEYDMTFPASYNLAAPRKAGVRCFKTRTEFYEMGMAAMTTPFGNVVRAYNAERCLCDIVIPRHQTNIETITEAFRRYVRRPGKNLPLLSEYAGKLKVDHLLRPYLEVLL